MRTWWEGFHNWSAATGVYRLFRKDRLQSFLLCERPGGMNGSSASETLGWTMSQLRAYWLGLEGGHVQMMGRNLAFTSSGLHGGL